MPMRVGPLWQVLLQVKAVGLLKVDRWRCWETEGQTGMLVVGNQILAIEDAHPATVAAR